MITGELKNKIDRIWDTFWSGGIANPLEVIEQITYLLFLRRLDDLQTLEENKSVRLKRPMERHIFLKAGTRKADLTKTCAGPISRTLLRQRCLQ
ncbi:type I restriction-modification system subunit M N-terminal domain-containing protein [Methanosarcina barkeri]|uniref:type I restriction-modification system subunit M N-terminal domain-containing protein n=1 Tax=Methanosarcina barkeri TaxID=2208 RepID=UPI000B19646A|nr:type I restriction-modification system subunit M N-terminal domain-containing protein [Methanosarcina barkeri]